MTGGPYGSRPGSTGSTAPAAAAAAGLTGGPLRAESWSLSSQFGHKGAVKAISDAYDQTLPKIPDPPGKVRHESVCGGGGAAAAAAAGCILQGGCDRG
jgi:hypothetical protein